MLLIYSSWQKLWHKTGDFITETVGLMEPMLLPENVSELSDLALDLATKASAFAGMLNPVVAGLWVT